MDALTHMNQSAANIPRKREPVLTRWLPRSLEWQVMLVTSVCLVLSILGYGYYRASEETATARRSIAVQMIALAQNLAAVDAHFLRTNEPEQIEVLTLHTATVDGIYSVLVTDINGRPLSEVVNKNGSWSPRYNTVAADIPGTSSPDSVFETQPHSISRRDFLAGTSGTMTAWHRIGDAQNALGWIRINYRLDTFDAIAQQIRWQAAQAVLLAIFATLSLLSLLLRPMMRALREATEFAARLDTAMGTKLRVSHRSTEIEALGNALNVVSERLLMDHAELSNQKYALDQHAIVSITDLNGIITYANQLFCDISGFEVSELLGQNHRIVKSDEHPPAFYENLWRTITQGQVWRGDIKSRKKGGGFYWVSATIVPLIGLDGLPHHYIGIRTDITANKLLEQRLKLARDEAEAATLAKGQFLANMSHEIRTPMNAVLGMLKLLQNTDLSKRQFDYANKAEGAARSLLGLLNDILDFSKIDAGKMSLESHRFRIDKLMRDISVIVSANLGAKPVEVLFDIDPKIPRALLGDAMRLQQVLINLSGNAIKFTSAGEVVISILVTGRSSDTVSLQFAVRDSGIGIAPENLKHIFDGFSQAEASTTRRYGGTGLGLSISRRLIALMGGELGVESELGKGSTFAFTITLPVAPEQPRSTTGLPDLPSNLRVLVVDDNPTAREVLAGMAGSLGWQVDLAAGGAEALAAIHQRAQAGEPPYQAVFVDWQMPEMDGWETITRMKGEGIDNHSSIIVMVTANGREMLAQRSSDEQARLNAFLVKPVTASMLFDAVVEVLAVGSGQTVKQALESAPQPLLGMRLLVVEDNIINQQVAQEMLSNEGAQIELADNGQLGVDAVYRAIACGLPFDAVLMDIQMPVMDGYSATRLLRQNAALSDLPIIAMTANAMTSDRDACLAAGMNAHVGKPFKLLELVELLQTLTKPGSTLRTSLALPMSALGPSRAPEPALPHIDAVDMAGALERLGGNSALYARVLQSYLTDIERQPDLLESALDRADWGTAATLLHTLKGLSGTVGASYMAAVARQAELAIKSAATPEGSLDAYDIRALHTNFRAAVVATQAVMGQVAKTCVASSVRQPAAAAAVKHHDDGQALLRQLRQLLNASDMNALAVFELLQQNASIANTNEFAKLTRAVAAFDFVHAAELCALLLKPD
jgi:two-component system sensor histidine kinase/response regulator